MVCLSLPDCSAAFNTTNPTLLETLSSWASRIPHPLLIFPPPCSLRSLLGWIFPLNLHLTVRVPQGSVFLRLPHYQSPRLTHPVSSFDSALDNTQISICNPSLDSRPNGLLPTPHLYLEVKKASELNIQNQTCDFLDSSIPSSGPPI